jgi:hypothetical protein
MLGKCSWDDWIAVLDEPSEPGQSRLPHDRNSADLVSLVVLLATIFVHRLWPVALGLFPVGWIFQFVGHAFEGKAPEFFGLAFCWSARAGGRRRCGRGVRRLRVYES